MSTFATIEDYLDSRKADPADPAVEPEWNPLGEPETVTIGVKLSHGRASVLCRRWSGRERLRYEDAMTTRLLVAVPAEDGGDPGETLRLGTMSLLSAALTIVGSNGFGQVDGREFLTGTPEQREADLLSLSDGELYDELREIAVGVQPPPREDTPDPEPKPGDGDGEADASDPSPTPSTPHSVTAAEPVDAPVSPVES